MPCLQSEVLESMEPKGATSARASFDAAAAAKAEGGEDKETRPLAMRGMGWFFSPLWSPRSKTRRKRFQDGMKRDQVEAWLDDHSDFTREYFLRRASV